MNELIKLFVELPTYVEMTRLSDPVNELLEDIGEKPEIKFKIMPQTFDLLKLRSYMESDPSVDELNIVGKPFVLMRGDWANGDTMFWIDMDLKTFESILEESFNSLKERLNGNEN